jgi:hypothetical protein
MQRLWGQRFRAAAGLLLGAELYVLPVAPAILSPVFVRTVFQRSRHGP